MLAGKVLSPQEQRIEQGDEYLLTTEEARKNRARVNRLLKGFRDAPPRVAVDRARLFTESFRDTENLPLALRWAKALENICQNIPVYIGPDELIVGRCGPPGRYGLLYPELRCGWLETGMERLTERKEGKFRFTSEDVKVITGEILPYWRGKTLHEAYVSLLPADTRRIIFGDNLYGSAGIIQDNSTINTSLNWALDYEKVLARGFSDIRREAAEILASLDVFNSGNTYDRAPFLQAVITVCDAMVTFAGRYAALARSMADEEKNERRKNELLKIAEVCDRVPGSPAGTFHEAVQSQWFSQVGSRFEQLCAGQVGNGRIDQYLYPYYKKDIDEGRISKDEALELLECLWLNSAQCLTLPQTTTASYWQGYAHFEHTTIGGQTRDGRDATNELSYLILQSKKEFPLNYPDLSARIHAGTPDAFLWKVCELIKEGTGFPKLLNDEAIIPLLLSKGGSLEEARDYTGGGCTEVRMLNRDTYMQQGANLSLGAALAMALNGGRFTINGKTERVGADTGNPGDFKNFSDVMNAFNTQTRHLMTHLFVKQTIQDSIRPQKLAAPLLSCLHDLCMQQSADIHQGRIQGASKSGNCFTIGFGTVVDSLAAIKKLVFDDKSVSLDDLLTAAENNFEGKEALRQSCLNAPKYGNNDPYADSIGAQVEETTVSIAHDYTNLYGGIIEIAYVPVTSHIALGAVLGATPNGRRAGDALSEGASPSQGCDTHGPTATLLSVARSRDLRYNNRGSTLLNMKLSPQSVAGDNGTRNLMALIRSWCDLKLWHIQFNIINSETLKKARQNPEKYRNLLVRVAGYSAYFVDLSSELQKEIIHRMEHDFV